MKVNVNAIEPNNELTQREVLEALSEWTNIPVSELTQGRTFEDPLSFQHEIPMALEQLGVDADEATFTSGITVTDVLNFVLEQEN